ncbi:microsomal glutathione S-transferase 1-like [Sycon ciliatum]|uniref:microsomal glutathione S-transferase 1-like n=1 Tax=Sycon ciliatum TaxID=27933 RepID=UPI0020AE45BC|eukprot:scpid93034/ scgid31559/ Microsomal glutathione S-transferase 1; Microsomal GST-I
MPSFEDLLSLDNAVFSAYLFYTTLSIGKTLLAANVLIPLNRVTGHVYQTPEDYTAFATPATKEDPKAASRIDKLRKIVAHDLENIVPFAILGLLYMTVQPSPAVAIWHYRVYGISRLLHTLVYAAGMQPARFLCFLPGSIVNHSMVAQILYALCTR